MKTTARYRRKEGAMLRQIAGETLLIPVKGALADLQRLYVLEGVGAFIWERLGSWRTAAEIEKELVDAFEVEPGQAEQDLAEFVAGLQGAGLLEESA